MRSAILGQHAAPLVQRGAHARFLLAHAFQTLFTGENLFFHLLAQGGGLDDGVAQRLAGLVEPGNFRLQLFRLFLGNADGLGERFEFPARAVPAKGKGCGGIRLDTGQRTGLFGRDDRFVGFGEDGMGQRSHEEHSRQHCRPQQAADTFTGMGCAGFPHRLPNIRSLRSMLICGLRQERAPKIGLAPECTLRLARQWRLCQLR